MIGVHLSASPPEATLALSRIPAETTSVLPAHKLGRGLRTRHISNALRRPILKPRPYSVGRMSDITEKSFAFLCFATPRGMMP
jgi:hypothetical protein